MSADPGTAQLEPHSVRDLPRQPDGRPHFLDHKRIAATRCVADLLRVLGIGPDSYDPAVLDRVTELLIDMLPLVMAEESA